MRWFEKTFVALVDAAMRNRNAEQKLPAAAMLVQVATWVYAVVTFEQTLHSNVFVSRRVSVEFRSDIDKGDIIGPLFDLATSLVGKGEESEREGNEMQTLLRSGEDAVDTEARHSDDAVRVGWYRHTYGIKSNEPGVDLLL